MSRNIIQILRSSTVQRFPRIQYVLHNSLAPGKVSFARACLFFACLLVTARIHGQWTEQVIFSFVRFQAAGDTPRGTVIQGTNGILYGTTSASGTASGSGTIFKLNPDGSGFKVLHTFYAGDGLFPDAGLIQGADRMLYGTAISGGANDSGTVFRLATDGAGYATVYSFGASATDGKYPSATLVQGRDGALYGTTWRGGLQGYGTVFKLNPDGSGYAVLHSFGISVDDGQSPTDDLIQGTDNALYGLTPEGSANGFGTAFKLGTNGSGYVLIHTFGSSGDGTGPYGALVQGRDGFVYGTTYGGGPQGGGTVFKLSGDGNVYGLLHNFGVSSVDARNPPTGLTQGADGYLYGATYNGGANNNGAVFKINTDGTDYGIIYNFRPSGDVYSPSGALTQGRDGVLYGASWAGGANGSGAIFRLAPSSALLQSPQVSAPVVLADGTFRFALSAVPNLTYRVDCSSNLVDWVELTNVQPTTSSIEVRDASAKNAMRRFYRAGWDQ